MTATDPSIRPNAAWQAYRACTQLAHGHYENFPVASWLLPRPLRGPVAAIYVFARRADDHADEGQCDPVDRLAALDAMEGALDATLVGNPPDDPLWPALAATFARHELPAEPLRDLLSAFRQDVRQSRYRDFDEVLAYCQRSADPVGRLLLHLAGAATPENLRDSDRICTALQLINFLQDLHQDFIERDRLYIPQDDLARHGVDEARLARGEAAPEIQALLAEQIERAADLLQAGSTLPRRLRGRFALEIKLIVRGGWRIVERLRAAKPGDPFARPRLTAADRVWIARGLWPGPALRPGPNRPPGPDRPAGREAP
ncbi:MAG: squalene synthase HpnC [Halofilum sp. (in: g-proteobacteria)]